jgi:putative endonuclease
VRGAFVYIMSNKSHTLYVGATTELQQRVLQHKNGNAPGSFTRRYRFTRLVWYEVAFNRPAAMKRERQIKAWSRRKKVALIQSMNPNWDDLSRKFVGLLEVT